MTRSATATIIGAGPAGLMAAERLATAGVPVTVYDRMPSVGRKFLLAGRGGLNLTHSEPLEAFLARYGPQRARLAPAIAAFPPPALRAWSEGLGQATFEGSSGRVFPRSFKTSPLLRAWLARLTSLGVVFRLRQLWTGWDGGRLAFVGPDGGRWFEAPSVALLALGGASWPRLGTDGSWVPALEREGISVAPLEPANCGFETGWSDLFRTRFAGQPVKPVVAGFGEVRLRGEAIVTDYGLEGGVIYALSRPLREAIARDGAAVLTFDLRPDVAAEALAQRLGKGRGAATVSNFLRKAAGLSPVAVGLLREATGTSLPADPGALARLIKTCPVRLTRPRELERAISTAGGVRFGEIDAGGMLIRKPGVFVAGEMLDWEAPTGGYLLQATFATAVAAADGMLAYLRAAR